MPRIFGWDPIDFDCIYLHWMFSRWLILLTRIFVSGVINLYYGIRLLEIIFLANHVGAQVVNSKKNNLNVRYINVTCLIFPPKKRTPNSNCSKNIFYCVKIIIPFSLMQIISVAVHNSGWSKLRRTDPYNPDADTDDSPQHRTDLHRATVRSREPPKRSGFRAAPSPRKQPIHLDVRAERHPKLVQVKSLAVVALAKLDRFQQQAHSSVNAGQRRKHGHHDDEKEHGRKEAFQACEFVTRGGGAAGAAQRTE